VSVKALCESIYVNLVIVVASCMEIQYSTSFYQDLLHISVPHLPHLPLAFCFSDPAGLWPSCFTKCNDSTDVKRIFSGQFTTEL